MRVGVPAIVTQDARAVDEADAVVLPGDGAFHDAMASLARLGLARAAAPRARRRAGRSSASASATSCCSRAARSSARAVASTCIPGRGAALPAGPQGAAHGLEPRAARRRAPRSSTASRAARTSTSCTRTIPSCGCEARGSVRWAWCEYGVRFPAAVETGRIYATQFHPEKSQRRGIRMLENFAALVKERAVIVIPAVDLRDGRCVRLREGRADAETVFSDDPVAMAAALGGRRRRAPARRRSRRRLRRRAASDRAHRARSSPPCARCPSRSAAACATSPPSRRCWRPARAGPCVGTRAALDPAFLARRCAAAFRAASSWPSTRAATGWRSRAGRRPSELTVADVGRRAREAGAAVAALHRRQPRRHRARAQRGRDGRPGPRRRRCRSSRPAAWAAPRHCRRWPRWPMPASRASSSAARSTRGRSTLRADASARRRRLC